MEIHFGQEWKQVGKYEHSQGCQNYKILIPNLHQTNRGPLAGVGLLLGTGQWRRLAPGQQ